MAGNIKGITIQLGADTTKLSSALSSANKAIRTTQSELRSVEKALKMNPGNIDLLRDKQRLLGEKVTETKNKLDALKQAQKQLDASGVDKSEKEYKELATQIDVCEQELKQLEKEQDNFGSVGAQKIKAVGDKWVDAGGKIKAVGDTMTQKVTTPILAGGAAAIASFTKIDAAMDEAIKKTGATGKEAEKVRGIVKNIATSVPADYQTVANAVGEVSTRFNVQGKDLENLSTKFVKFADLNNTDVVTSVDSVQKAMATYGLNANQAGSFLDRLNKVSQDTGVDVNKLAEGVVTNGTAFKQMGLNIDQATTFMGGLEKSGANSSTVMNGLRKALKNATKDGTPLNVALQNLQNTIQNGTGDVDGLTAAYDLFGKSGDQIYQAVKDGTINFNDLATGMGNVADATGNVDDTFNEVKDPTSNLTTAMNNLLQIGYDITRDAMPMITQALTTLKDIIETLSDKWNGLSDGQKEFIIKAALVAAAIGPILSALGSVVMTIGLVMTAAPALAGAIGAIAGPVGIVIAVIAGLVAEGILLYKNWDTIKEKCKIFIDGVKKSWEDLKKSTTQLINSMITLWNNLKTKLGTLITNIVSGAKTKFEQFKTSISNIFEGAKKIVMSVFNAIKTDIQTKIDAIKGMAKFVWNLPKLGIKAVTSIPDKVEEIVEKIKKLFNFKISLPNIKLPHIRYHWKQIGDILKIPVFDGVDWYAKAYDKAAYFSSPTVRADGRGFGDRQGGEFAVGERHLRDVIRGELAARGDHPSSVNVTVNVTGAQGQDVKALAEAVSERLRRDFERERLVWA